MKLYFNQSHVVTLNDLGPWQVWQSAVEQCILSFCLATGCLVSIASHNDFYNDVFQYVSRRPRSSHYADKRVRAVRLTFTDPCAGMPGASCSSTSSGAFS